MRHEHQGTACANLQHQVAGRMCLPECCATAARRAGQGRIRSWRHHCTRTHRTHRNRSQLHSARWATELATNQRPQTQHTAAKVLHMHLPLLQQTCGSGATHSARKLPALPLCAMNCHTHAANLPRINVQAMQDMPLAWTDGATAAVASRHTTTRVRTDIMIAPEVLAAAKDTRKGCDTCNQSRIGAKRM